MSDALRGRAAIITGASRGLGLAIAEAYAAAGADLLLCARGAEALAAARDRVLASSTARTVETTVADVSHEDDVSRLVGRALDLFPSLDILVSNAAIHGPMGRLDEVDWDEWRQAVEVDLFGPVLLCRALLPHLRRLGRGKIIQISGGGATASRPRFSAYAASKTAVVRLVETLAAEVSGEGIDINAIAPGALDTYLLDDILKAGPERAGPQAYEEARRVRERGSDSRERAAALAVFLASSAGDGISGRLISAVWDPWSSLSERRAELAASDIYTLRRIVPEDRGVTWDP